MVKPNKIKQNPRSNTYITNLVFNKTTSQQSLEKEALELTRCMELNLETDHVHPVRIVGFDKKQNTLATQLITGKELFHIIWNSTYLLGRLRGAKQLDFELMEARYFDLGDWLKKYHQTSTFDSGYNTGLSWISEDIERKFNYIIEHQIISHANIEKIRLFYSQLYRSLTTNDEWSADYENLTQCKVHADFIVYNILVDDNFDFHVLDFSDVRQGCCLDDVGRFYSGMYAISQTSNYRKEALGRLATSFLAGYGYSIDIVNHPYFKLVMLYNFLIQFCAHHKMRKMQSLASNFELKSISTSGYKWIKSQLRI